MIRLEAVHKSFGEIQALRGFSFDAPDGRITGILGPNGAGKTTALRAVYGLTEPDAGTITVDDHRLPGDVIAARRELGVFTDKFGLYDRLSTREQLDYFAELNGLRGSERKRAVTAIIDRLGIQDIASRRSEGFSQGQRMKVGLARALVHQPQNLVLDEPTRGLDVMSTRNLRTMLSELRDEGRCIVFSSHVMHDVTVLCDRVVIMRDGQACAAGSPAELCEQAQTEDLEEAFLRLIGTEEGIVL